MNGIDYWGNPLQPVAQPEPKSKDADDVLASLNEDVHPWCVCRWSAAGGGGLKFCGPLGFDFGPGGFQQMAAGLGVLCFPHGKISPHLFTLETRSKMEADIAESPYRPTVAVDRAVLLSDLHFSVELFSSYDSSFAVFYDGGDFVEARRRYFELLGVIATRPAGQNYLQAEIKCVLKGS